MTEPALLRMALGLILVIALILACAWLARRSGMLPSQRHPLLRQIDHLSLGARAGVAVIEVQDTWLIVGVTPGQITTLHTLPAGTLPTNDLPTFPKLLSRVMRSTAPRAS